MRQLFYHLFANMQERIEMDIAYAIKRNRKFSTITLHPEDTKKLGSKYKLQVLTNANQKRGSYTIG